MAGIYIITYGCTANQDNTAIIKGILSKHHEITSSPDEADIIIINSCIVKSVTANKIKSAIEKYHWKKLIITGCMPGSEKSFLKKLAPDASLVNTFNIKEISSAVDNLLKGKKEDYLAIRKEEKLGLPKIFSKNKISLQIAEGCVNNCSFCETKLAKGRIKSFSPENIANELKQYIGTSYKMINITSTDNGCYGIDIKTNLPALLKKLASIKGDFSLRIGMMNPKHVVNYLDDLIDAYRNNKIIKVLHIPLQSGSNKILKDMNRNYTAGDFRTIVKKFRKEIPGINICTDIIVGYPKETEEDFQETIALIKELKPEVINISKFSSRPGTKAAKLKQLPTEVIKSRSKKLTEESRKLKKYNKKIRLKL